MLIRVVLPTSQQELTYLIERQEQYVSELQRVWQQPTATIAMVSLREQQAEEPQLVPYTPTVILSSRTPTPVRTNVARSMMTVRQERSPSPSPVIRLPIRQATTNYGSALSLMSVLEVDELKRQFTAEASAAADVADVAAVRPSATLLTIPPPSSQPQSQSQPLPTSPKLIGKGGYGCVYDVPGWTCASTVSDAAEINRKYHSATNPVYVSKLVLFSSEATRRELKMAARLRMIDPDSSSFLYLEPDSRCSATKEQIQSCNAKTITDAQSTDSTADIVNYSILYGGPNYGDRKFPDHDPLRVYRDVLQMWNLVAILHEKARISHGDLASTNFVFQPFRDRNGDDDVHIRLIDFGLSTFLYDEEQDWDAINAFHRGRFSRRWPLEWIVWGIQRDDKRLYERMKESIEKDGLEKSMTWMKHYPNYSIVQQESTQSSSSSSSTAVAAKKSKSKSKTKTKTQIKFLRPSKWPKELTEEVQRLKQFFKYIQSATIRERVSERQTINQILQASDVYQMTRVSLDLIQRFGRKTMTTPYATWREILIRKGLVPVYERRASAQEMQSELQQELSNV